MEKKFITSKTEPEVGTDIHGQFNFGSRFPSTCISPITCKEENLIVNAFPSPPCKCKDCIEVANSMIIDSSAIEVKGSEGSTSGNLIHRLLCFGTVATMQNAPNMCEFIGNSEMRSKPTVRGNIL